MRSALVSAPGNELAGVSCRSGTTAYYSQNPAAADAPPSAGAPALLEWLDKRGKSRAIADLAAFERKCALIGATVYGVWDVSMDYLAQTPDKQSKGKPYSHP
ncbi:hypothetical protein OK351_07125 [Glutamicibacter sp. MNS18]|uniref:hypothetical protein n=1 Tax=Glutamicibacter sp. MNS18 TaxID=2989817 RepID=UPI002236C170|nr:hypothetical protein [Glutamicibacter sp. MNS18]MCW4465271.1 hypothetical protein [Glutamicibacter sp. MNS18]